MLQIFLFIKLSPKYLREHISWWKISSLVCGNIFHGEKPPRQSAGTYFMVKNLLVSLREDISWWKTFSSVCGKIFHDEKPPRQSAGRYFMMKNLLVSLREHSAKKPRQNKYRLNFILRGIYYPKHKNHIFKELLFPKSMPNSFLAALLFRKQLQR